MDFMLELQYQGHVHKSDLDLEGMLKKLAFNKNTREVIKHH